MAPRVLTSLQSSGNVAVTHPDIPSAEIVSGSSGYEAPNDGESGAVAPAAAGDVEAADMDVERANDAFSVAVDGVSVGSSFPLSTIRQACTSLGLARSGGKSI